MENTELIKTFIEIETVTTDEFLKIKETLSRMGIASRKENAKPILWQSCHILHKRGKYYIVHFKQMFLLDGKSEKTDISDGDYDRLEVVASLLETWGLINPKCELEKIDKTNVNLVVISYADKHLWDCRSKYSMGVKTHDK